MGCGSSKGDVIKSATENSKDDPKLVKTKVKPAKSETNGTGKNGIAHGGDSKEEGTKHSLKSVSLSESSTIPASDMYQNGIDNSVPRPLGSLPPLKPPRTARIGFRENSNPDEFEINQNRPNIPIAFEVPADDAGGGGASLIKRHPPRRLRKMVEEQPEEPVGLTHATIEEKVQQANERRNQVLTQRVASARQKSARVRRPFMDTGGMSLNEFDGEIETGEKDESNNPDYLQ